MLKSKKTRTTVRKTTTSNQACRHARQRGPSQTRSSSTARAVNTVKQKRPVRREPSWNPTLRDCVTTYQVNAPLRQYLHKSRAVSLTTTTARAPRNVSRVSSIRRPRAQGDINRNSSNSSEDDCNYTDHDKRQRDRSRYRSPRPKSPQRILPDRNKTKHTPSPRHLISPSRMCNKAPAGRASSPRMKPSKTTTKHSKTSALQEVGARVAAGARSEVKSAATQTSSCKIATINSTVNAPVNATAERASKDEPKRIRKVASVPNIKIKKQQEENNPLALLMRQYCRMMADTSSQGKTSKDKSKMEFTNDGEEILPKYINEYTIGSARANTHHKNRVEGMGSRKVISPNSSEKTSHSASHHTENKSAIIQPSKSREHMNTETSQLQTMYVDIVDDLPYSVYNDDNLAIDTVQEVNQPPEYHYSSAHLGVKPPTGSRSSLKSDKSAHRCNARNVFPEISCTSADAKFKNLDVNTGSFLKERKIRSETVASSDSNLKPQCHRNTRVKNEVISAACVLGIGQNGDNVCEEYENQHRMNARDAMITGNLRLRENFRIDGQQLMETPIEMHAREVSSNRKTLRTNVESNSETEGLKTPQTPSGFTCETRHSKNTVENTQEQKIVELNEYVWDTADDRDNNSSMSSAPKLNQLLEKLSATIVEEERLVQKISSVTYPNKNGFLLERTGNITIEESDGNYSKMATDTDDALSEKGVKSRSTSISMAKESQTNNIPLSGPSRQFKENKIQTRNDSVKVSGVHEEFNNIKLHRKTFSDVFLNYCNYGPRDVSAKTPQKAQMEAVRDGKTVEKEEFGDGVRKYTREQCNSTTDIHLGGLFKRNPDTQIKYNEQQVIKNKMTGERNDKRNARISTGQLSRTDLATSSVPDSPRSLSKSSEKRKSPRVRVNGGRGGLVSDNKADRGKPYIQPVAAPRSVNRILKAIHARHKSVMSQIDQLFDRSNATSHPPLKVTTSKDPAPVLVHTPIRSAQAILKEKFHLWKRYQEKHGCTSSLLPESVQQSCPRSLTPSRERPRSTDKSPSEPGVVTADSPLPLSNSLHISSDTQVYGDMFVHHLHVSGMVSIQGNMKVDGYLSISGKLEVAGFLTVELDVRVHTGGTLKVDGGMDVKGRVICDRASILQITDRSVNGERRGVKYEDAKIASVVKGEPNPKKIVQDNTGDAKCDEEETTDRLSEVEWVAVPSTKSSRNAVNTSQPTPTVTDILSESSDVSCCSADDLTISNVSVRGSNSSDSNNSDSIQPSVVNSSGSESTIQEHNTPHYQRFNYKLAMANQLAKHCDQAKRHTRTLCAGRESSEHRLNIPVPPYVTSATKVSAVDRHQESHNDSYVAGVCSYAKLNQHQTYKDTAMGYFPDESICSNYTRNYQSVQSQQCSYLDSKSSNLQLKTQKCASKELTYSSQSKTDDSPESITDTVSSLKLSDEMADVGVDERRDAFHSTQSFACQSSSFCKPSLYASTPAVHLHSHYNDKWQQNALARKYSSPVASDAGKDYTHQSASASTTSYPQLSLISGSSSSYTTDFASSTSSEQRAFLAANKYSSSTLLSGQKFNQTLENNYKCASYDKKAASHSYSGSIPGGMRSYSDYATNSCLKSDFTDQKSTPNILLDSHHVPVICSRQNPSSKNNSTDRFTPTRFVSEFRKTEELEQSPQVTALSTSTGRLNKYLSSSAAIHSTTPNIDKFKATTALNRSTDKFSSLLNQYRTVTSNTKSNGLNYSQMLSSLRYQLFESPESRLRSQYLGNIRGAFSNLNNSNKAAFIKFMSMHRLGYEADEDSTSED